MRIASQVTNDQWKGSSLSMLRSFSTQIPYHMMKSRVLLLLSFMAFATGIFSQSSSQNASVLVSATVQNSPPRITLNWVQASNTSSISIYRKLKSDSSWGSSIANPSSSSTQYQDNSVQVGVAYEYKIVRSANGSTGTGYIASGIEVPLPDYRGKLILLVDNTLAPQMTSELNQLQKDLKGDGWAVIREDVSRTASASSIRNIVVGHYNNDPSNVKAVYMVGHVPVPYSGNAAPDGHSEHVGAWPCDGYYGEMNGSWTDNSVYNSGAQRQANRNIPGDGKFDQSNFPSDVELQVGRVDLYEMPAFSQSEVQLVKNYLNRAHSFKVKGWTPLNRGLVFDNLQWVGSPIAGSAWRNMGPLVGASNITDANENGTSFHNLVNGESYLWTYSSGGGTQGWVNGGPTFNGANNIGTTNNYAANSTMGGVFNMSCGSYFGDWDNMDNFLRAPIAKGDALTSVWAGIPAWYFHHMGIGDNIGYSTKITMNNSSLYTPLTEGWQGSIGRIHLGLMGDPSLRMQMIAPPTSLTVSNSNGTAAFSWSASPESNILGYHIYRFSSTGTITRLTTDPVSGTSYQNAAIPFEAGREYMVRAVKLQVNQSGSYLNLSLGAIATAAGSASADCSGVVGGSAVPGSPCNDNDPCTSNDTWNSNCQCVGTPGTISASITPQGPTSFCSGGSVVLSANTGSGYTYTWKRDGTTISGASGSNYTATQAGTYTVRISNGGCQTTSSGVSVSINSAPTATITSSGGTNFCEGGSVVLNANTGSGYTYIWKRDGTTISGANGSSYTASISGSYTVTIGSGNCSSTSAPLALNVNSGPVASISPAGSTTICEGSSVSLNATTGAGLSYSWQLNGQAINGASGSSFAAAQPGNYTVTVTGNGCSATSSSVQVSSFTPQAPDLTVNGGSTICAGGSVTISATPVEGATYSWTLNGSDLSEEGASIEATEGGTYGLQISTGDCISAIGTTEITVLELPEIAIGSHGPTMVCTGDTVLLNATIDPSYAYMWMLDGQLIPGAVDTAFAATLPGVYSVYVSNGTCSNTSATVQVSMTPDVNVFTSGPTDLCAGDSVLITAVADSAYSYAWTLDGVLLPDTNASITAMVSGTYIATIAHGACSASSAPIEVIANAIPVTEITANGPLTFCAGESVQLSTAADTSWTYQWSIDGVNIEGATSDIHMATVTGAYSVAVSNGGCTVASAEIAVITLPVVSLELDGPAAFCIGDSVVISAMADSTYEYTWSFNGVEMEGVDGSTITANTAGSYQVAIDDGTCSATSEVVEVITSEEPVFNISTIGESTFCAGDSVLLVMQSDNASYGVEWSLNDAVLAEGDSLYASGSGVYIATVNNNGCMVSDTAEVVTTLPVVELMLQGDTSFCEGSSTVLHTTFDSTYTYQWLLDGEAIADENSHELLVTASGNYSVHVEGSGCSTTSAAIALEVSTAPEINCYEDAASGIVGVEVLNGNGPFTYMWNGNAELDSTILAVEGSGIHVVTVTDQNGCSETCTLTITSGNEDDCLGLRTQEQAYWTEAALATNDFAQAFPDGITIGCGFRMLTLTTAQAVDAFLPSTGPSQRLPFGQMTDPGNTYGNSLAGELVALKIAVRFDELSADFANAETLLKDAVIAEGIFAGSTVAEVIEEADRKVGGCFSWFSRNQLRIALHEINTGYIGGTMASGYLECPQQADQPDPPSPPVVSEQKEESKFATTTTAYPNPFTEHTTIVVGELEHDDHLVIDILSADGVLLERVFDGRVPAGVETKVNWNGASRAMGVYFYRVSGEQDTFTGRLVRQ